MHIHHASTMVSRSPRAFSWPGLSRLQLAFALLPLVALVTPSKTYAQFGWSTVGAGCVATGQTIESGVHFNTAGRTKFVDPEVGEIILTCPITMPLANPGLPARLVVSYRDPDGMSNTAQVVAALRRMNKQTGVVNTVATFDSNTLPSTEYSQGNAYVGDCNTPGFDLNTYYYYVQINMTRSVSTAPVEIGALELIPFGCL